MRRVDSGTPFRLAYHDVAAALASGERFPHSSASKLMARRKSTGGLGNLGLAALAGRARLAVRWERRQRLRFDRAMRALAGPGGRSKRIRR
jgi:hypothetical protein